MQNFIISNIIDKSLFSIFWSMTEKSWEVRSRIDQVDRNNEWVKKQVREELIKLNKECFYEIDWEDVTYNMDTVKHYLNSVKDKKTWKELTMKNSSVLIMAVQIALYSQNYSFWRIDGLLWPRTKNAIRKFQSDNGLDVDVYWRSMPSTILKLLDKIDTLEKVELNESEKQEYLVLRPKDEPKEEKKPFNWEDINTQENTSWIQHDEKQVVKIPFAPIEESKPSDKSKQEEKSDKLPEDTIRSEVQYMIDNYRRVVDQFPTLTTLTLAEAKAIAEKVKWWYIYLSGVENLSQDAFEALLNFEWGFNLWIKTLTPEMAKKLEGRRYSINFNNLTTLEPWVAELLWNTECNIEFWSLKTLTPEIINGLSKKTKWYVIFNTVENIDDATAEAISKYPWKISLKGIKTISWSVAKKLWEKESWIILTGLDAREPLPTEVLEWLSKIKNYSYEEFNSDTILQLSNFEKQEKRKGKNLSQGVVDVLDHNKPEYTLESLKTITRDDAEFLVERWSSRDLSGVEEVDEETFSILMKNKYWISLWIKELPDSYLKYLEWYLWSLTFNNIKELKIDQAKSLATTQWNLTLNSLTNIQSEVANELSKKKWGDLILNWITELTPEVVRAFLNYKWSISLNNVKSITPEIATILTEKTLGFINLKGIPSPLPKELIPILAKAKKVNLGVDPLGEIDRYVRPDVYKR